MYLLCPQTVLRRLKCWECISVLRTTLGPMIEGSVNALLLPTHQFQQQMHQVSTAVAELAELVSVQTGSGPVYSGTSQLQQQSRRRSEGLRLRQADVFVLQLLLSYSVFDLLAALVDLAAIHGCRLAQLQQTTGAGLGGSGWGSRVCMVHHSAVSAGPVWQLIIVQTRCWAR